MRTARLINDGSPCDIDFTDKTMQTARDFLSRRKVLCTNLDQCQRRSQRETIICSRGTAIQMARIILENGEPYEQSVSKARAELLADSTIEGKFWVFRSSKWLVVEGKANVIDDIVEFARTIIDFHPGDRRPFTKDGVRPIEFGPGDALHNALLDLDDVYGEVGQGNPFRR